MKNVGARVRTPHSPVASPLFFRARAVKRDHHHNLDHHDYHYFYRYHHHCNHHHRLVS